MTLEEQHIAGNWHYSGDPAHCSICDVRALFGDIINNDQLVPDELISSAVTATGNNYLAAARMAEHLAMRFSREADTTVNDGSGASRTKSLSQRASAYRIMAAELRTSATSGENIAAMPYCGGISIADKDTREGDTDRVAPAFTVGMYDHT